MKINTPKPGFGIFGGCLAVCGLVYGIFWEAIFNKIIQKTISLHPDSSIFEMWRAPPAKATVDFYFFNWTNPQDFYNANVKPKLEEVGPYRFFEVSDKVNISWHPENGTVSYSKRSFYYFDEKGSRGPLSDTIVSINVVPLMAAQKISKWHFFQRKMAAMALNIYENNLVVTSTVDQMLFKGHEDIFLNAAYNAQNMLKEVLPFDKFGYAYLRNGSTEFWGTYNVYTGVNDFSNIGQVHTWNFKHHTDRYDSHCGTVTGAAGEYQPPNLKVNSTISYYIPDICRSFPLDYTEPVEMNGVSSFKYVAGLRALDNGTLYPENKCYCVGECIPSGVMNIAHCWFDIPIHFSFPHFYNADPSYLSAVEGLAPKKEDHEMFVILDRRTGFLQKLAGRLQLNLLVEPLAEFRFLKNAPRIVFPIVWIDYKILVPHEIIWMLQLLPILYTAGKAAAYISVSVGVAMIICHLRARFSFKNRHATFDPVYDQRALYEAKKQLSGAETGAADSSPLLEEAKSSSTLQNYVQTNSYG